MDGTMIFYDEEATLKEIAEEANTLHREAIQHEENSPEELAIGRRIGQFLLRAKFILEGHE